MNSEEYGERRLVAKKKERLKDMAIFCVLAIALLFAVWQVFGEKKDDSAIQYSEKELKIARLLEGMQGVGDAEVMIYEGEEAVQSVVVLCDGARDLQVIISVREAVATALGMAEKNVKVYLKKE